MSIPVRQSIRIGTYLMQQKLRRRDKFPMSLSIAVPLSTMNSRK